MKKVLITIALALTVLTLNTLAQDAGGPPPIEGGQGGGSAPKPGLHLLPPRAVEQLKLTDDQKKQVADLEVEVKAKMEKILTTDQLEQLKQMRPPMRQGQGGSAGEGQGAGARRGGQRGGGSGNAQGGRPSGPPPGEESNQ